MHVELTTASLLVLSALLLTIYLGDWMWLFFAVYLRTIAGCSLGSILHGLICGYRGCLEDIVMRVSWVIAAYGAIFTQLIAR